MIAFLYHLVSFLVFAIGPILRYYLVFFLELQPCFKCEKCDKAFRLKIFLDKHLDFNCERQEKYCEQCKLWIKSKKWSNHVRMEHVVDTEIPCDKCKLFSRKKNVFFKIDFTKKDIIFMSP